MEANITSAFDDDIQKRWYKWDNAKFSLIFLVVLGHLAEYGTDESVNMQRVFFAIYLFHMPAFIFISGLFSKKNIDKKRYENIFYYLGLYFFIKIIFTVLNYLIEGEIEFSLLTEDGLPWYAFILFVSSLICIVIKDFNKKYMLIAAIVLGCFVGYDNKIEDFLMMSRTIVYFPFFLLGYYLDIEKLSQTLQKINIKIISLVYLIFLGGLIYFLIDDLYWLRPLLTGRNPFERLDYYSEYGAILRLLYYFVVFSVIVAFFAIIPSHKYIFTKLGSRTVQVYAFHLCFISVFYKVLDGDNWMKQILPENPYLLIVPIAVVLTVILSFDSKFFGRRG